MPEQLNQEARPAVPSGTLPDQGRRIDERGGSLARCRYQVGSLMLRGDNWVGRWREYANPLRSSKQARGRRSSDFPRRRPKSSIESSAMRLAGDSGATREIFLTIFNPFSTL